MDTSDHSQLPESRPPRLPTIDAALQRTPLTSIVPFDPDVIPFPSALPGTVPFEILTEEEQRAARKLLADLDALAVHPNAASSTLSEPLRHIQRYLNADNLTELRFKALPLLQHNPPDARQMEHATQQRFSPRSQLGPMSKLILNSTDVRFRYPTPPFVDSSSVPGTVELSTSRRDSLSLAPEATTLSFPNAQNINHNSTFELESGALPTPSRSTNGQRSPHGAAVIIPPLPQSSDSKKYEKFTELDTEILQDTGSGARKRKRTDELDDAPIQINFDQQHRADEAVGTLLDLIQDKIFVAEDHLEPDTSGAIPTHASEFFISAAAGESESWILKSVIQIKLHTAMQNVILQARFQDIPVEYLARLQKICSVTLRAADGLDLAPPDDDSEESGDRWAIKLELADNALLASRCLLKIMNARSQDKELCSEEVLQEILTCLKHALEDCIIPIAEIDDVSSVNDRIQAIVVQKTALVRLMQHAGRVLKLLGDLLLLIDISESITNTLEFLSTSLIFVESNSTEKDSVLGPAKLFALRQNAMEVVAKVFFRKHEQRQGILTEILSSLEKLPVTRQSARQFKVIDKKPITLVSALIMQVIQISSTKSVHSATDDPIKHGMSPNGDDASEEGSPIKKSSERNGARLSPPPTAATERGEDPFHQLIDISKPLFDSAQQNATYVAKYLIERALTSSKSGDQPYRNLLDIFVEDFINVLGSTDWPAAEMLLRVLLSHLIGIVENEKSNAPAKNMALDLMGLMGSGIADLQNYVRRNSRSIQQSPDGSREQIGQLADMVLEGNTNDSDVLSLSGPYRAVTDYLRYRDTGDLQIQSALAYYLSQWAKNIWTSFENARIQADADEEDEITPWDCEDTALWLRNMLTDQFDRSDSCEHSSVTTEDGRFSYAISVLTMPFCKALRRILNILLKSLSSSQIIVRNRSLISIGQLVEKDPGMLDRADSIMGFIVPCFSDQSPQVRNSALGFIEKFLALKPELEGECCSALISISSDASVAVRRHTIKLLKGIYLRNKSMEVRSSIADSVLQRLADTEESVRDLARQTIEEVWLMPFYKADNVNSSTQFRYDFQQHASLVVATTQRGDSVFPVLESLFKVALTDFAKNKDANYGVCKVLVTTMFDSIIDNEIVPGMPSQQHVLQTLTIFAKAEPRLFNGEQMNTLEPYIKNVSNHDNFLIYRSVIVIFRCVLPVLPSLSVAFLSSVQSTLLQSVSRLGKLELNEVAQCLWIIDGVLKNTERLVKLTVSLLSQIHGAMKIDLTTQKESATKIGRLIRILGYFGKACNLENYLSTYKEKFTWWESKKPSVSGLMVDILLPFTSSKQPMDVRRTALESICLICQSWPKNFLDIPVSDTFEAVFKSGNRDLELVILTGFKAFYDSQEHHSQENGENDEENTNPSGADKLGKSMTVNENDGASSGIAQQFLAHVLRIAMQSTDNLALLATEIIVSTNSQGLVHPRECGPALIALSTSPNELIAKIASKEHQNIHQKHESMLEKQYLKAIEQAVAYQKTTVGQISGVADDSSRPKLKSFFDALKTGSVQSRKKLYANLCTRLNLELSKLPQLPELLSHVQYTSFVLQNLSLADYSRIDELLHLTTCIEKIFMGTGTVLSHSFEAHLGIPLNQGQMMQSLDINGQPLQGFAPQPELLEYQSLTAVSMVMSMFWETRDFLRRTWNLTKYRGGKAKLAAKDLNKAPIKNPSSDPHKLLEKFVMIMSALNSPETMQAQCRAFIELLSVDNELRVSSEDDDQAVSGYETPSEADNNSVPPSGGSRGSKRRVSVSATSTPSKSKKRGKPSLIRRGTSGAGRDDDDDSGGWD